MSGNEKVSEHDVLCAVSDSPSRVPVARPPQPEEIMARGRARGGKVGADMVIGSSAIPGGVGLQLAFSKLGVCASGIFSILGRIALVRVSQQCTGS